MTPHRSDSELVGDVYGFFKAKGMEVVCTAEGGKVFVKPKEGSRTHRKAVFEALRDRSCSQHPIWPVKVARGGENGVELTRKAKQQRADVDSRTRRR